MSIVVCVIYFIFNMPVQEIRNIAITDLKLWSENPRDPLSKDSSDYEIIKNALFENKTWELQKLLNEMGEYYDLSELPTVVDMKGKLTVLDGNRRIAVLKYLQDPLLYQQLEGGLFYVNESIELKNLKVIPCNVCDLETALNNIERKHINSKSWGCLERDYFLHNFRNIDKSLFIQLDEHTQAISQNPALNQRFVKEEVLTEKNLNALGFSINEKNKIVCNHTPDIQKKIIENIVELIKSKTIDTRKNRGDLITPFIKNYPEIEVKPFNSNDKIYPVNFEKEKHKEKNIHKEPRKTRRTKTEDILFGRKLTLVSGKVNNLYSYLDSTYKQVENDSSALLVLAMSLRLLLEVAGREYFQNISSPVAEKDMVYKDFLKIAREDLSKEKAIENYFSLTKDWLNGNSSIEGLLGKYAHGNIVISRLDVVASSKLVGDILAHYFSKK